METETTYDAIRRLQQEVDRIDQQIIAKKQRLINGRIQGPMSRLINQEIQQLNDKREAISRNILQLKIIESSLI